MSLKAELLIASAVVAIAAMFVVPIFFRSHKPTDALQTHLPNGAHPRKPKTPVAPRPGAEHVQSSKKSWSTSLIPVYTIAVVVYFFYIVYKITAKKYSTNTSLNPPNHILRSKGNQKTKITKYELAQLETKLLESEEVIEKILEKVNKVTTQRKKSIDSLLSSSSQNSDSEANLGSSTTSSGNNDTHQDSSSSASSFNLSSHHRKYQHRPKRIVDAADSTSSEEAENRLISLNSSFAGKQRLEPLLNNDSTPTNQDQHDVDADSNSCSEDVASNSKTSRKARAPVVYPGNGDQTRTKKQPIERTHKVGGLSKSSSPLLVETVGCSVSSESCNTQKKLKDANRTNENQLLVETTQLVLAEMKEIREYLEELKG